MPVRLWKSVGADILAIIYNHYLCIIDYYRKFPVVTQVGGFREDNKQKWKIVFSEYRLPSKIVSDMGTSFI